MEFNIWELLRDQLTASVILAIVIGFFSYLYHISKTKGLPPGPVGLPLLGYWPFLKNDTCHFTLQNMQKKYGDIFSFNYAGALYINMGSPKAIRELHVNNGDCFERIYDYTLMREMFKNGVVFVNGEPWKVLRKFILNQFKELGITSIKDSMGGPIYESIQETVDYLRKKKGEPVEIVQLLTDKCNSILRRTMFGNDGITEQEVLEVNQSYGEAMGFMAVSNTLHAGTFAKYFILPLQPGYRNYLKHIRNIDRILTEVVNRHKLRFDEEHPRDFIDAYFKERNDRYSKGDPTASFFTDKALVDTLHQFVGDGVLGVSGLVSSYLSFVVENEEEQEKMFSELMEIVGQDRAPTIDDKSKLTYTNALMLEILRVTNFFPFFPSLQCIRETTVRGFRIPKRAITLMNAYACHNNPDIYDEPEKFNPLRFIPKEGKSRPELPVTFGLGKRNCIGEGFTMTQVFLFLTTIVKNFQLTTLKILNTNNLEQVLSGQLRLCAHPRN